MSISHEDAQRDPISDKCPPRYAVEREEVITGDRRRGPYSVRIWWYPTENNIRIGYNRPERATLHGHGTVRFSTPEEALAFCEGLYWCEPFGQEVTA